MILSGGVISPGKLTFRLASAAKALAYAKHIWGTKFIRQLNHVKHIVSSDGRKCSVRRHSNLPRVGVHAF